MTSFFAVAVDPPDTDSPDVAWYRSFNLRITVKHVISDCFRSIIAAEVYGRYLGMLMKNAITETPTIRGYTGAGVNSCSSFSEGINDQ